MTHVLTVIGARPQFIKASPVSRALRAQGLQETVVHTGQHYDASMSQVFFDELGMDPPQVHLDIGSGTHGDQTGRMLAAIERTILASHPDVVLVYGDTNSTLAGALAAAKLRVPIAHVEAGLRSWNRAMPEEINRIVADAVSDLLFAPTLVAVENLTQEGRPADAIVRTGDVMFDAALQHSSAADARSTILASLALTKGRYLLATVHRAENTDDPERLRVILGALGDLSRRHVVVLPLHPRTRTHIHANDELLALLGDTQVIPPVGYLDMIALERSAALIVTDSGGVQKEAYFHGVPCVTLRNETEWTELIALGWNRLCPPDRVERVVAAAEAAVGTLGLQGSPYGDGNASALIAQSLASRF
ncbi:MAG: UDP-N-acetylglucosamine 2-epimerase [Gemmatimonadetes bacterium]|nr:UDP-N-acetylglucosamine 2-epimerase [Gemmatimonadota bacterium]